MRTLFERIALFGVIAIIATLVASVDSQDTHRPDDQDTSYIIIIDGGSTGSRLHVHPFLDTRPLPTIYPSLNLKLTPGLSSYENHPEDAGESLQKLLDFAKENIPRGKWSQTPLFLKATAGLRSIPADKAEQVLQTCRRVIKNSPFIFRPENAEIISGSQEGIFGWITANYLDGTLKDPKSRTVGVIEMGGASMQVTFVPDELPDEIRDHTQSLQLGDRTYQIYTHSYLSYGLEAAQKLFNSKHGALIAKDGHPCVQKDFESDEYSGKGHHEQCVQLMKDLFDKRNCSHDSQYCTFNGVVQPPIRNEKFYAIENYFYTSDWFKVSEHTDPYSSLEQKGREFCELKWGDISITWPKASKTDLIKYCFSSVYLPTMLKHGINLPHPHLNTKIKRDINGFKLDWALGAALYELMALPSFSSPQSTRISGGSDSGSGTTVTDRYPISIRDDTATGIQAPSDLITQCTLYGPVFVVGVGVVLAAGYFYYRRRNTNMFGFSRDRLKLKRSDYMGPV